MPPDPCLAIVKEAAGISDQEARELLDRLNKERIRLIAEGKVDRIDRQMAFYADQMTDRMKAAAMLEKKHAALNVIRRQELEQRLDRFAAETGGNYKEGFLSLLYGSHRRVGSARKSIAARRQAILAEWVGAMTAEISRERPHLIKALRHDRTLMEDITREMYELHPEGKPGITGNEDARFMAGLLAKYSEASRIRLNQAGAYIGRLAGWAPQAHDAAKVLRAGKDAWDRSKKKFSGPER